ncbi:MAG: OmpA family protein [Candidatus Korobacteraceae bacterium]|jgi:outer membrane protein OmpA-like peptidoglycan-associated protein
MTQHKRLGTLTIAVLSLIVIAFLSPALSAQSAKTEGLITGRSGDTMTIQTADSSSVVVVLTDTTQVAQVQGAFKARRKQMSMAALVPGLQVKVEGSYNPQSQLVANSVTFKGNDLEDAEKIQAGLAPAKEQIQQSEQELAEQKAALARQQQEMQEQQQQMKEAQDKIDANKAAIEAANKRFGQLDDYNIMDEVTVYFGNGKVKVDPKYIPQLLELAKKAETITGYVIQVKGYASSVGSASLNQKLSDDRANNVTNILIQQAHIPLTRMLAPGAMGEAHQVGNDKTAEGQAQNRRVVVRVLQNKGIAGT